jgi:D-alanyl-D-alanine carboxypeptidase/D-alanyl-D-alanine-endopeptidase (penicillin-binding protein 4)
MFANLAMRRRIRPIRSCLSNLAATAVFGCFVAAPAEAVGAHPATAERRAANLKSDLATDLAEIARKSGIASQRLAFVVHDVGSNSTIASQNADAPMAPASNMKVITTGAALLALGSDFTFDTTLYLARTNGTTRLTLVGSGDPALDDPELRQRDPHGLDTLVALWADELRKLGTTRVDELVIDARIFDREFYHPSWPKEQYPNAYCAEVWGINVARNVVGITPIPQTGGSPNVVFTPAFDLSVARNNATTRTKDKFTFTASRAFGSNDLTLRGNAAKKPSSPLALTVHDTPALTATLLRRSFASRGIDIALARIASESESSATGNVVPPIHATPLATVLERANTDSENLYAEALLKRLGARHAGRAALRKAVAEVVGAEALSLWTFDDGSGLSQENRLTAGGLTRWLAHFARDPKLAPTYFGSFAIAGKTGTVRRRFDDLSGSPVEVRCKTGYIRGVSTLSGIAIAPDGRVLAFAILGNNLAQGDQIARARTLQEAMVRRIARELAPSPPARAADGREPRPR